MLSTNNKHIHEKTVGIPIKQNSSITSPNSRDVYSLKKHFFDPTKNSPPNDFMIKLQTRMAVYDKNIVYIKDCNLDKE